MYRDALGLQESNLYNKVSHGRFHEASEIAWKQLSSQFWGFGLFFGLFGFGFFFITEGRREFSYPNCF